MTKSLGNTETSDFMARNYCFTIHDRNWDGPKLRDEVKYLIAQLEKGEETEKEHWQGYIELYKTARFKKTKEILGANAHIEARKGTRLQAYNYCTKEDTRVTPWEKIEIGEFNKTQGQRTDLQEIGENIRDGIPLRSIAEESPSHFIKYYKGMYALRDILDTPKDWRNIKVYVIWGKTGVGKTTKAKKLAKQVGEYYKLNQNSNGTLWFDGYYDQKTLIIDDFYGWIKWGELLTLLDGHPYRCQIKGSSCWAKWKYVIITSNQPSKEWYPGIRDTTPLKRRITKEIELK